MKLDLRQKMMNLATVATLGLGGLGLAACGVAYAQSTTPPAQTQPAQAQPGNDEGDNDGDMAQSPSYTDTVPVDETQTDGLSEAEESAALQGQATIDAATASAAAIAANPGASVVKSELDSENGFLVYSVELDTGLDVKVDAGDASILATEQDDEGGDEANEANEGSEVDDSDGGDEANEGSEIDDSDGGDEANEGNEGSEANEVPTTNEVTGQ